jgi:DNA modification methylase
MILAGTPKEGIVLDPFMGSGTTAVVARKLGRNFIGIELNPAYIKIAEKRLAQQILI